MILETSEEVLSPTPDTAREVPSNSPDTLANLLKHQNGLCPLVECREVSGVVSLQPLQIPRGDLWITLWCVLGLGWLIRH